MRTLNGLEVLLAEGEIGDRQVVNNDIEMRGPLREQMLDALGDLVPLREQLRGRELRDHRPQNLIADGRKHLLLIVLAEAGVDHVQLADLRVEQHPHRQLDALHVAVGSLREDLVLPRLHVVDDRLLDEGQLQVVPLPVDLRGEAEQLIELDGVVADIDCVGAGVP